MKNEFSPREIEQNITVADKSFDRPFHPPPRITTVNERITAVFLTLMTKVSRNHQKIHPSLSSIDRILLRERQEKLTKIVTWLTTEVLAQKLAA